MTSNAANDVHPHAHKLKNDDGSWRFTNNLVDQTSPYLLQHAHNPVDWHPWGQAAFDEARKRDVPIFLSVGYSTCYWCHVMERQVFEDPTIAAQMNELFVCIKVDREERPDVDDIYMMATQLMTGSGGWPMSVFLTPPGAAGEDDPGLKPFWAGTYIPPTPQQGRPGFPQVLDGMSRVWLEKRDVVIQQADRLSAAVTEALVKQGEPGDVDAAMIQAATDQLLNMFDREHGGFGGAPKFPQPAYLQFLLAVYENNPSDPLWQVIGHTLDKMARGGMYDQVGGGFHRYSTDERWLVPHFEKMLYDNAQLVELYALVIDKKPTDASAALYQRVIRETCDYVMREMTDSTGAFWSAQDAEVNAREGENYVWTEAQVRDAISDPGLADLAVTMYGLDLGTNFQDPHDDAAVPSNVLFLPRPLASLSSDTGDEMSALLEKRREINQALKAVRDERDQPGTDDKALLSWNGMMIAALADAGRVLDEPAYIDAAARAADAILSHMTTEDGGLYRTMRKGEAKIPGFLEDYAWFVHGLLALNQAQPDVSKWLDLAKRYTLTASERFATESGGYYDTLADQRDLFVRVRGSYDGAVPSANGRMIHNQLDLYDLTGDAHWLDRAETDLRSFAEPLARSGAGMVQMEGALLRALELDPARFAATSESPSIPDGATDAITPHASMKPVAVSLSPGAIQFVEGVAELTVTLDVGSEFHINSHTPSEAMLIPTNLSLVDAEGYKLDVRYPEPASQTYAYVDRPLSVFHGKVQIKATISRKLTAKGAFPSTAGLLLQYQACTDTACLPPVTERLPLIASGE
jgi:uncharacterized protein YyaL (SSP411 family)